MDGTGDLAALSSLGAQLDDLAARVTALAQRYGDSPDSAVAAELFAVERALLAARRSVDRAARLLEGTAP
jgi:hypothetical protein